MVDRQTGVQQDKNGSVERCRNKVRGTIRSGLRALGRGWDGFLLLCRYRRVGQVSYEEEQRHESIVPLTLAECEHL